MNDERIVTGKRKNGNERLIGVLQYIEGGYYIFPEGKDAPLNSPDWFEVSINSVKDFLESELVNK
jgi:hypothetical protein